MLKDDIQKAIFTSLKAGQKVELKVLRFILSQIKYEEINKQRQLSNEETISLIQKEVKKRREAIEMFKKGNREDLVADEEAQLDVIGQYLPKQLSNEELNKIVEEIVASTPDKSNIGKIVGLVMAKVKGRADGQIVADLVRGNIAVK